MQQPNTTLAVNVGMLILQISELQDQLNAANRKIEQLEAGRKRNKEKTDRE